MFQEQLHVGRPNVGDRDRLMERFSDMLDRRRLTNDGPYVQELEQRVADFLGAKHCVAVCNGTVGLEIAIRACGLRGEVIVPAFTFVATAHALLWQGLTPVFCDIDPVTHNIDPEKAERLITPRTTAILAVHVWGRACNIAELSALSERHGIELLFDAAHAFGCSENGRMIGTFGTAEIFSFHATKFFNTLEGGAIVTDSDEVAHNARLMRNFGYEAHEVLSVGTNGKMNEASAAMGLTLFEDIDDLVNINRRNYRAYDSHLSGLDGVTLVQYDDSNQSNYQYVVVEVDERTAGVSAGALVQALHDENVLARRYFYPACHQLKPFRSRSGSSTPSLPEAEALSERVLCLPTGTAIDVEAIEAICRVIRLVVSHGPAVQQRLG